MVHQKYTVREDYAHGTKKRGNVNWKFFYSTADARSFFTMRTNGSGLQYVKKHTTQLQ